MKQDHNLVLDLSFCGLTAPNSRITNYWAITLDHLGQNPAHGSARLRSRLSASKHLSHIMPMWWLWEELRYDEIQEKEYGRM